jgi:hypothetical protein
VWATAIGAAYSCSGAAVPASPVDASEGEIYTAKNYVTEGNWIQDLGSGTMLDGTSSASSSIKLKWYERGEGVSYTIVQ